MKVLVTGVAGFIGSHLAEKLLDLGHKVIGIDYFSDYYARHIKEHNIATILNNSNFQLIENDIVKIDLNKLLKDIDVIMHMAAQAGVRASWGRYFETYLKDNVKATQMLLESAREVGIDKFVYASSSSVYGNVKEFPMKEDMALQPVSPYGVTKLAGENLCQLYYKNYALPTISLRFFTVYGPRQRPDMAFHKFFKAILQNRAFTVYGDGEQTRDFTFISDIIEGCIRAMNSNMVGRIYNIGGGSNVSLKYVINLMGDITGKEPLVVYEEEQKGDVRHTIADTTRVKKELGFEVRVSLEEGLREELSWIKEGMDIGIL